MLVKAAGEMEKYRFDREVTVENITKFIEDFNNNNLS
jgi:hypothetical protein